MCSVRYSLNGNLPDGSTRLRRGTQEIKHFACMSSFAEYGVVPEGSLVKVPDHIPLDKAALVGCCVTTGVGAAVFNARERAALVRSAAAALVDGLVDAAGHDADDLTLLHTACVIEAQALRAAGDRARSSV